MSSATFALRLNLDRINRTVIERETRGTPDPSEYRWGSLHLERELRGLLDQAPEGVELTVEVGDVRPRASVVAILRSVSTSSVRFESPSVAAAKRWHAAWHELEAEARGISILDVLQEA